MVSGWCQFCPCPCTAARNWGLSVQTDGGCLWQGTPKLRHGNHREAHEGECQLEQGREEVDHEDGKPLVVLENALLEGEGDGVGQHRQHGQRDEERGVVPAGVGVAEEDGDGHAADENHCGREQRIAQGWGGNFCRGGGGSAHFPDPPPPGGVFAQCGHSANYYVVSPGNTPANHPPTGACMIHSKQHRGCRIQNPGTRGYRWWKPADFSHSARTGTAHGAPP